MDRTLVAASVVVVATASIAAYLAVRRFAKTKVSSVSLGLGEGGQEVVRLRHASGALADVYLHGATVTRYATASGIDILWLSSGAKFDGKNAIRGGVPLVFPQFGPEADGLLGVESMSQHGFVRKTKWSVVPHATEVTLGGECRATLSLDDSDATRAKWPHKFRLEYSVTLTERNLRTALKITNLDGDDVTTSFQPQALLHTYLRVDAVEETGVKGLAGCAFLDQLTGETRAQSDEPIAFVGETDRIYDGGDDPKSRAIEISAQAASPGGSVVELRVDAARLDEFGEAGAAPTPLAPDVVVWNPHVAKAKAMADFDDDGWKSMCCVEPGILNARRPPVEPGNSLLLGQTITHYHYK